MWTFKWIPDQFRRINNRNCSSRHVYSSRSHLQIVKSPPVGCSHSFESSWSIGNLEIHPAVQLLTTKTPLQPNWWRQILGHSDTVLQRKENKKNSSHPKVDLHSFLDFLKMESKRKKISLLCVVLLVKLGKNWKSFGRICKMLLLRLGKWEDPTHERLCSLLKWVWL